MSSIESFISIACGSVLPVLMFNKLIFFIIYKLTRNACIIDIGYTVGHLLAGIVYAYRLTTFDFGTMVFNYFLNYKDKTNYSNNMVF
jgi:hypothetical protein